MGIEAKICGLKDQPSLRAALDGGAAMIGFVFYPPSPRAMKPAEARPLAQQAAGRTQRIALIVDAENAKIAELLEQVPLDGLQLHGSETPKRVHEVKQRFGLPVIKAISIGAPADLQRAREYEGVADRLLFDAKPPADSDLPGGNAVSFDWSLLSGVNWEVPWMLSGGLRVENLARAVRETRASLLDVSSGVESSRGVKDPARIAGFLAALRTLDP